MWMDYQGAFNDWLAAGNPGYECGFRRPGFDPFHKPDLLITRPYWAWRTIRDQHAAYRVLESPMSEPGWRLIARDSYRDFAFKRREIFTYRAIEANAFK
jgi:hypothetical protein